MSCGSVRWYAAKNGFRSTAKSRTTGRFLNGSMRRFVPTDFTSVLQVSRSRPFTTMAQEPHIPTRHENRNARSGQGPCCNAKSVSKMLALSAASTSCVSKAVFPPGSVAERWTLTVTFDIDFIMRTGKLGFKLKRRSNDEIRMANDQRRPQCEY